jgi:hypothetical protein
VGVLVRKIMVMLTGQLRQAPGKVIMTLIALSLGTAILILSVSASAIITDQIGIESILDGTILYAANGTMDRNGAFIKEWPPKWDPSIQKKLVSNISAVENAALITLPPFHDIISNGDRWKIRSAIGSDPAYFDVFSLNMIAGVPMDDADIDKRTHRIWISEELSGDLFGSVDGVIGEEIACAGPAIGPDVQFFVAGVYASPREPQRKAWGIGDMVVPYTAFLKTGHGGETLRNIAAEQVVLKIDKQAAKSYKARIRSFLIKEYGDDAAVSIWEGSPRGLSAYMEQLKRTANMFTIQVNILGFVLLIISSFGIFSIMVVESVDRRREIALERTFGAVKTTIMKEFWALSTTLSLIGAAAGSSMAFLLKKPFLDALSPFLVELMEEGPLPPLYIPLKAMVIVPLCAILCGGVVGFLPAIGAVRGNISNALKEPT